MAVEDAVVFGALFAHLRSPDQIPTFLGAYQELRQPRCQRIVAASNSNARNYHMRGPTRAVAHAGLRAVSKLTPGLLVERFAWLYDYDPTAAV